jgi:hypothetical protein
VVLNSGNQVVLNRGNWVGLNWGNSAITSGLISISGFISPQRGPADLHQFDSAPYRKVMEFRVHPTTLSLITSPSEYRCLLVRPRPNFYTNHPIICTLGEVVGQPTLGRRLTHIPTFTLRCFSLGYRARPVLTSVAFSLVRCRAQRSNACRFSSA